VNKTDIADNNLVLFGDPSANKVIAEINAKLPIHWVKDRIVAGADSFPASEYTLAMIYPNPLNRNRVRGAEQWLYLRRSGLQRHKCTALSAIGRLGRLSANRTIRWL